MAGLCGISTTLPDIAGDVSIFFQQMRADQVVSEVRSVPELPDVCVAQRRPATRKVGSNEREIRH